MELNALAETGYGIVLDGTRRFLARLVCHRGNSRDCARFPSSALCPPRVVADSGMCVFADDETPGLGGGGSLLLTFAWAAPAWESCRGLDQGVRTADAQVALHDPSTPRSRETFRAQRSQAVPVRVTSRSGKSNFFMSFTVVHSDPLQPSEVSRAIAARCGALTALVAAVFHKVRPGGGLGRPDGTAAGADDVTRL